MNLLAHWFAYIPRTWFSFFFYSRVFLFSSLLISYRKGFHDAFLVSILLFVPFVAMLFDIIIHVAYHFRLCVDFIKTWGCVLILRCTLFSIQEHARVSLCLTLHSQHPLVGVQLETECSEFVRCIIKLKICRLFV